MVDSTVSEARLQATRDGISKVLEEIQPDETLTPKKSKQLRMIVAVSRGAPQALDAAADDELYNEIFGDDLPPNM
jgi:hypothetical protein